MAVAANTAMVGAHTGSELATVHKHRLHQAGWPGLILLHGRGGDHTWANSFYHHTGEWNLMPELARHGFVSLVPHAAGNAWSNATALARVEDAKTYLHNNLGVPAGPVVLIGFSMGALTALNYARANPAKVSGLCLLYPVVDLEDLIAAQPSLSAEINAALGTSDAAGRATHDPSRNLGDFSGRPYEIKFWYSTDDPTARPQPVIDFASAIGAEVESMGAVGHSMTGFNGGSVALDARQMSF